MKLAALVSIALLCVALCAEAQMRQGRGSRERPSSMDAPQTNPYFRGGATLASDPMAALERELPSLRTDLRIAGEQGPLWESFERQVRDIAELGRTRQKHLQAPLEADKPPPPAMALVTAWADDDRARASAMGDLVVKLEALQRSLNADQRKELDRRIVLSQTEPLNAPAPSDEKGRRRN
jgi:hypothetical protein